MKTLYSLLLFTATVYTSFPFPYQLRRTISRRPMAVFALSNIIDWGLTEVTLSAAAIMFILPMLQKKFSTEVSPFFLSDSEKIIGSEYRSIVSAMLAGLNVLPTEESIPTTSGRRKVEYQRYRCLSPTWKKIADDTPCGFNANILDKHFPDLKTTPFECIDFVNIIRTVDSLDDLTDDGDEIGAFRVYKMKLTKEYFDEINCALVEDSLQRQSHDNNQGMQVSNAGGYHSVTDYFNVPDQVDGGDNHALKDASNKIRSKMAAIASLAVNVAEANDFSFSNDEHAMQQRSMSGKRSISMDSRRSNNKIRQLQGSVDSEAWININRHGNWNRLHTHEGSAWSGVYYLQCPSTATPPLPAETGVDVSTAAVSSTTYSGRLLIKPSPHISEIKYELSKLELGRLNCFRRSSPTSKTFSMRSQLLLQDQEQSAFPTLSCCDYLEIEPEEGMFIIMPGWLQHAVFPLQIQPAFRDTNEGTRISLAFNFAEE